MMRGISSEEEEKSAGRPGLAWVPAFAGMTERRGMTEGGLG